LQFATDATDPLRGLKAKAAPKDPHREARSAMDSICPIGSQSDCLAGAEVFDIERAQQDCGTMREEAAAEQVLTTKKASTKANKKALSKKTDEEMQWDIFISYRVNADAEQVKELYWQLCNLTVAVNGNTRKLRVFWDKECLRSGERWEDGFASAICSSHLIVLVVSRNTFKMEGKKHNVETLTEESSADNVILEWELALNLAEIHGTAVLPLFVGDKDASSKFSHFFESGCMPVLCPGCRKLNEQYTDVVTWDEPAAALTYGPVSITRSNTTHARSLTLDAALAPAHECTEVIVRSIFAKVSSYLEKNAGVAPENMPAPRSVNKILSGITQFQGFFLQGIAYDAVKGAVQYIHACVSRLVQEQGGRQQLEQLQFSTPQGEEVFQFLLVKTLSCYGSTLARNKLNSLRKVSQLKSHQLDKLHEEFCATCSIVGDISATQLGRRVALGEAVEALKGNPRTKTLKEQLYDFSDPKVRKCMLVVPPVYFLLIAGDFRDHSRSNS